jgi:hypothetical protein
MLYFMKIKYLQNIINMALANIMFIFHVLYSLKNRRLL